MTECTRLPTCPFFNGKMASTPGMVKMLKAKYCLAEFTACARFMVFSKLGPASIPKDLLPQQTDRAKELIAL